MPFSCTVCGFEIVLISNCTMPRQKFTCEQKNFARALKNEGKKPCEIIKRFKDRYGVVVKASTMSTWYNDKNMETHEQRVSRNTSMASVETHVNPGQRPTIMLDMEFALLGMIKKANNIGTTTPRKSLQNMGKAIFDKLRASNIYDGPGRRRRSLSVLNEVQIRVATVPLYLSNVKKRYLYTFK